MAKSSLARKHEDVPRHPDFGTAPEAESHIRELDRIIHERIRLAIVSALAPNESVTFTEMKKLLNTTDGNLSIHARKLEDAGYISCVKYFEGRVPKTEYRITPEGRKALNQYLDHMEALIKAMRTP
ncbi:MAG: transcriptional regulator [Bryobacteraceae bacterium]|nr:transcriptional regulator [Bryobacteraceae bacterium]